MLTHRVKTYAQKFIIMIEIVKIEAQSSFESGQQHHQSGAALANRFGQDRLLGNPTYSDKSSADSFVNAIRIDGIPVSTIFSINSNQYNQKNEKI